jgi:hypothetical protein
MIISLKAARYVRELYLRIKNITMQRISDRLHLCCINLEKEGDFLPIDVLIIGYRHTWIVYLVVRDWITGLTCCNEQHPPYVPSNKQDRRLGPSY